MDLIDQAVKTLKSGGLIIFPTETCYGAGVDATNPKAVAKLLAYKTRREGKPLSIAVTDQTMAAKYVILNPTAINLYKKFLPGPLTVISKAKHKLAPGIESETNTLAIRIPDYPLTLKIIKTFGKPITATSANVSYKPRPYSIPQLLKYTSKKQQQLIDLIINAGKLPIRPVSTIVDTTLDDPLVLRQGKILHSRYHPGVVTHSPQETSNLAKTLMLKHWRHLQTQPLIFLLIGDLGAGKTQFCKGIGEFLKIKPPITSPTYTLEKEYSFTRHHLKGKFLHLDTWRLQNPEELTLLNLENRLLPKTVCAIEWANRSFETLKQLSNQTHGRLIILTLKTFASTSPSQRRITVGR